MNESYVPQPPKNQHERSAHREMQRSMRPRTDAEAYTVGSVTTWDQFRLGEDGPVLGSN